jgi:hypothetical protein
MQALGVACLGAGGGIAFVGTMLALYPDSIRAGRSGFGLDVSHEDVETVGIVAAVVGGLVAVVGGTSGLRNRGYNRLSIVGPERAEGPQLIGLGLAPTADGHGLSTGAAFSF